MQNPKTYNNIQYTHVRMMHKYMLYVHFTQSLFKQQQENLSPRKIRVSLCWLSFALCEFHFPKKRHKQSDNNNNENNQKSKELYSFFCIFFGLSRNLCMSMYVCVCVTFFAGLNGNSDLLCGCSTLMD